MYPIEEYTLSKNSIWHNPYDVLNVKSRIPCEKIPYDIICKNS